MLIISRIILADRSPILLISSHSYRHGQAPLSKTTINGQATYFLLMFDYLEAMPYKRNSTSEGGEKATGLEKEMAELHKELLLVCRPCFLSEMMLGNIGGRLWIVV
jgi:hypothetical protein